MIITPGQSDQLDERTQQKFSAAISMAKSIWELCNDPDIRDYSAGGLITTTDVSDPTRMGAEYSAMDQCAEALRECRETLIAGGYPFITIEEKMTAATNHVLNLPVDDMLQVIEAVVAVRPEYGPYADAMRALQTLRGKLKIIMAPFLTPVSGQQL